MTTTPPIIDSHVHLDLIARRHPQRIAWLKANHCTVVSWAYFEGVDSVARFSACLDQKAACVHTQAAGGLNCYYLAGVHPRSIPPDLTPEAIAALLARALDDPRCLGIGEIGLETGDVREKEVLHAQLELGRSKPARTKVIGVHTPRTNKPAMTAQTLAMLEEFSDLKERLVVDHCTLHTIARVLDAGFWAGVTLSPVKTSWDEMKRIVAGESARLGRIMGNTDSGSEFFEDVVRCRRGHDLSEPLLASLFHDAAKRFYRLPG